MDKEKKYLSLLPQINALVESETDLIANLANVSALIHQSFQFHWIRFYLIKHNELVLGPFQGPPACTRIKYGNGVCGTAWKEQRTLVVPDVHKFPGHIACSPLSLSEIVVPVFSESNTVAILDIDSDQVDEFDQTDKQYLEQLATILAKHWPHE